MRLRLALLFALLLPGAAEGQVRFQACKDRTDHPIAVLVDNSIAYAGVATFRNEHPVILWNARTNRRLPYTEQLFIYLHECAHHVLDHLYHGEVGAREELEADCWAIQLMVDGGLMRARQLAELERTRSAVRGDETHLGGEAHVRSLEQCLRRRTDPKVWAAALDTLVLGAHDGFASRRGRLIDSSGTAPVHEALLDVPGTYDCEVVGSTVRCWFFEAGGRRAATGRYRKLSKILKAWLPRGWTSAEQVSDHPTRLRRWIAQDGRTRTLLTLTLTETQLYLLIKRLPV
ncbi:MAG TPA: hypothetical protein VH763_09415 [Gemmatimonadales bacterium]|jgi:hypothetical protein